MLILHRAMSTALKRHMFFAVSIAAAATCVANPPDCGQEGRPCCILQDMVAETQAQFTCMTNAGNDVTSGVTRSLVAPGYTCSTQGAGDRWPGGAQVTCQRCPEDWKMRFASDSDEYKECNGTLASP